MGVGKGSFQRGMRPIIYIKVDKKSLISFLNVRVLVVRKYEQGGDILHCKSMVCLYITKKID